jgi:hypothetical protein
LGLIKVGIPTEKHHRYLKYLVVSSGSTYVISLSCGKSDENNKKDKYEKQHLAEPTWPDLLTGSYITLHRIIE